MQFVVVDEREEHSYAGVTAETLAFSPTGRDLVYAAAKDASKRVVTVSGVEEERSMRSACAGSTAGSRSGVVCSSTNGFHAASPISTRSGTPSAPRTAGGWSAP